MESKQSAQEPKPINTKSLVDIAIYLSGVKDGKGNLLPLGTIVLDDLWDAIKYLKEDARYFAEDRKEQPKNKWVRFDEKHPPSNIRLLTKIDGLIGISKAVKDSEYGFCWYHEEGEKFETFNAHHEWMHLPT